MRMTVSRTVTVPKYALWPKSHAEAPSRAAQSTSEEDSGRQLNPQILQNLCV